MFWKILGLVVLVFLFILTMKRVRNCAANLMYVPSLSNEMMVWSYKGNFQKKDLVMMSYANLLLNVLILANVLFISTVLMGARPEWLTTRMGIFDFCISLAIMIIAYSFNKSINEIISPIVRKAKNIKDFTTDERDLLMDTEDNIEQTYLLCLLSLIVLALTIL